MQLMVPKEIMEADKKIAPWVLYSLEKDEFYLDENASEEIKKLYEKSEEWHSKHHATMN